MGWENNRSNEPTENFILSAKNEQSEKAIRKEEKKEEK